MRRKQNKFNLWWTNFKKNCSRICKINSIQNHLCRKIHLAITFLNISLNLSISSNPVMTSNSTLNWHTICIRDLFLLLKLKLLLTPFSNIRSHHNLWHWNIFNLFQGGRLSMIWVRGILKLKMLPKYFCWSELHHQRTKIGLILNGILGNK